MLWWLSLIHSSFCETPLNPSKALHKKPTAYFPNLISTHSPPIDCSLPDSSVHGTSQARLLELAAISFSRGSSWPRDLTHISCIAGGFLLLAHVPLASIPNHHYYRNNNNRRFMYWLALCRHPACPTPLPHAVSVHYIYILVSNIMQVKTSDSRDRLPRLIVEPYHLPCTLTWLQTSYSVSLGLLVTGSKSLGLFIYNTGIKIKAYRSIMTINCKHLWKNVPRCLACSKCSIPSLLMRITIISLNHQHNHKPFCCPLWDNKVPRRD